MTTCILAAGEDTTRHRLFICSEERAALRRGQLNCLSLVMPSLNTNIIKYQSITSRRSDLPW